MDLVPIVGPVIGLLALMLGIAYRRGDLRRSKRKPVADAATEVLATLAAVRASTLTDQRPAALRPEGAPAAWEAWHRVWTQHRDLLPEIERSAWSRAVGSLISHDLTVVNSVRAASILDRGIDALTDNLRKLQRGDRLRPSPPPFEAATVEVLIERDLELQLLEGALSELMFGEAPDAVGRRALQSVLSVATPTAPAAVSTPYRASASASAVPEDPARALQQIASDTAHEHDHLLAALEEDTGAVVRIVNELVIRLGRGELGPQATRVVNAYNFRQLLRQSGIGAVRAALEDVAREAGIPAFTGKRYWPLRHPAPYTGPVSVYIEPVGHATGTISQRCTIVWGEWQVDVAERLRPGERLVIEHQKHDANDWPLLVDVRPEALVTAHQGAPEVKPGDRLVRATDDMWESWIG